MLLPKLAINTLTHNTRCYVILEVLHRSWPVEAVSYFAERFVPFKMASTDLSLMAFL